MLLLCLWSAQQLKTAVATMKIKHKGKIFPSPSSVSLPPPCNRDVLSVLKLLPAAILALASVLSLEDREVLAYMIARSLSCSNPPPLNIESSNGSKRSSKRQLGGSGGGGGPHKPPVFGCDCFDCYTSFWLRWDSSPNRELIHQVIEAFEEHLTNGEASSKRTGRGKRREKPGRRVAARPETAPAQIGNQAPGQIIHEEGEIVATAVEEPPAVVSTENEVLPVTSPKAEEATAESVAGVQEEPMGCDGDSELEVVAAAGPGAGIHHKGLARKVLPDVLGLLNSRLWNLWSPSVV